MTIRSTVTTVIVLTVAMIGVMWLLQRRMIYFPTQQLTPGLPFGVDEVTFETADGLRLTAWFLPVADSGGTVIVFNGNAGNRAGRLPLGDALREHGHSVLLVDYRGYGGNPGNPTETGLGHDARAALAYLESRPDVDPRRIAYFGESLGAAVAIRLASEHPPAALVLRSPFSSLADIASEHYPFLPSGLLLRDRYPNLDLIGDIDVPVVVIAGTADRIVPLGQSREVFEAAHRPRRFVAVEGADHNDWALLAGDAVVDEIDAFIAEVFSD
jgi:uncharacterized protein